MIRPATALLLGWVVACGAAAGVTDDRGRDIVLQAPARRIVTLAPHLTDLVVAAGAQQHLVAIAAGARAPAALSGLPRIGGPGPLDRETLLRLRPDLVLAWHSGNRAGDLDWIERSGIPVYRSEPSDLAAIAAAIRAIGLLTGSVDAAARNAAAFETGIRTDCVDLPPRPVYVEVWQRPPLTLGGRHWLNDVLHHAGWSNLFADVSRGVFRVAEEALAARSATPRISLNPDPDADLPAALLSRPGPGLVEAVQRLCAMRQRYRP